MNPPGRTDRVLGRPGSRVALSCLAVVALYGAATNQVPWPVPALLFFLAFAARGAEARMRAHRQWTNDWNEMAGLSSPSQTERVGRRRVTPGRFAFIAVWSISSIWLSQNKDASGTPLYACFATVFLAMPAGSLLLPVLRRLRGALPSRSARSARVARVREFIVSVCLGVPRHGPRADRIVPNLPDYARALLARSAAAPPS